MSIELTILEGAPNTGKTTAIEAVYVQLQSLGYSVQDYIPHPNQPDFQAVVTRNNKCLIIQSYTDMMVIIADFENYCKKNIPKYSNFDIMVIVPCRDINNPRLNARTMSVCQNISKQFVILKPQSKYFNALDILHHLASKGF